ncbi:dihydrolipoyl dehydrogenase [Candidatus Micrarchaeota archaeon]|nr:dihydrolipoyl dehydrogenase [Candidatus Micrarchaeota archaeon]
MVVGDIANGCQVAIIGGGPGGYVAAIRAAQLGKDVILIEKEANGLGGICLHHGCIPSKALIYAIDQYHSAQKDFPQFGLTFEKINFDLKKLQAWKEDSINKLTNGIAMLMKKYGINVIQGEAFFENSKRLHVNTPHGPTYVEYEKVIIATGSSTQTLPGFEVDNKQIITSTEALKLDYIPKSMIVLGAGYIALELGLMYAKLGTKVTFLARSVLASHLDRDLVKPVYDRCKELGVDIYEYATPERMVKDQDKVTIFINSKEKGSFAVDAELVMLSIGRKPNTQNIGLEKTKVQLDEKGFVKVDEKRRTTDPFIYAIGDITPGPMLAHKAFLEGKIAAECIAGLPSAYNPASVPAVIFSDPEIAEVGLTERAAQEQGIKIKVGRFPFSALGRAVSVGKSEGFVKIIADESQLILGIQIVGPHAGDMISAASLGIEMGFTLEDLALTIHPHPTFPEALMEAAEATLGRAIHVWQKK